MSLYIDMLPSDFKVSNVFMTNDTNWSECVSLRESMYRSNNPSALRSQTRIINSFYQLLNDTAYEEISVKQIISKSQISRKTFYRNFDSKEDVLISCIYKILSAYIEEMHTQSEVTLSWIIEQAFRILEHNKNFFQLLQRDNLLYLVLNVINREILDEHFSLSDQKSDFSRYIVYFNVGALFNVLSLWLEKDDAYSADDILRFLSDYMTSGITKNLKSPLVI
ncbi:TetR/AcrR family transcriptional regulator [Bifidobacterium eulemuris]|uniref:TetR/AcrR family transcriptional regulator n=2 Tax=Bifidobacterium eulemuris TaxID=1765219 RepID=A0A7L9SLG2_9BIFI|nr:TetR/AcrR family transcriptional regulator [Bifidobacterium eulemuris]QOL31188.1 TetR/AcrR family transcriptional regulator [Bifidobacterium eulemuris]